MVPVKEGAPTQSPPSGPDLHGLGRPNKCQTLTPPGSGGWKPEAGGQAWWRLGGPASALQLGPLVVALWVGKEPWCLSLVRVLVLLDQGPVLWPHFPRATSH